MRAANQSNKEDTVQRLVDSLLHFTQVFYLLRTGRKFELSQPDGRESHFITIIRALERVFDGKSNRLIINVPPRHGKAIDINTPILTRNGWNIAGNIAIGDELVGSRGWTKVTGVFPQGILPAKQVIFSDHQSVICNEDHLWSVCDRYTPTDKILKTSELQSSLHEADGRKHWRIPLINGEYGDIEPFVDPYLLGCWLGDGHSYYAAITTMDKEIVKAFEVLGHTMKPHSHQTAGRAKTYGIIKNGFQKLLRQKNLLKNKHIPDECYQWSFSNRLKLLQGLMDTDGTVNKNGQISFCNTKKSLLDGFKYLVNSLGGTYKVYKINYNYAENVFITLPSDINPFCLKRKAELITPLNKLKPARLIADIVECEPCEMVCFTVDSEDHLFAVGKGLILTHNTELLIHWCAWALAQYPDSNFIYTSFSHSVAKRQTQTIRDIITMTEYRELFGIRLRDDSQAKDEFIIDKFGGSVYAAGAGGVLTSRGAGITNVIYRFAGAIIIDDIIKPEDALSDVIRESSNEWYYNTLESRINSPTTPIILIGQRTHEDDLSGRLISTGKWEVISLPEEDRAGNILYPEKRTRQMVADAKKFSPFVWSTQYQQDPSGAINVLFDPKWFVLLEEEPDCVASFITCDTAETDKEYNDATVFSFWGVYKIKIRGEEVPDTYGLHWIDCAEMRIEPKDLQQAFLDFYTGCMRYKVKPKFSVIEKKSTGTTLASVLKDIQGLRIIDIERTKASGSKGARFLEMQPFVASKLISLPIDGKHTQHCINHMAKITATMAHRHDDICDTAYDAIKMALIDKVVINSSVNPTNYQQIGKTLLDSSERIKKLRQKAYN